MPSNLPIIRVRTTQKNIEKFKVVCEKTNRSMSAELELHVKNMIENYEKTYGEIIIDPTTE